MTYHAYTTLNEIREHQPCKHGWNTLLENLGKTKADDEPLHLLTILESNGFDDALWCLQAKSLNRLSRHFQAWCADQVLHHFETRYPDDRRVREQIAMLRNDNATEDEREAAWEAALGARRRGAMKKAVYISMSEIAEAAAEAEAEAAAWAAAAEAVAAWAAARAATYAVSCVAQEAQLRVMIGTP